MEAVSPRASLTRPDLAAVFDEHFDYVWNTLRRLGVRASDLEDQVQEVFVKVHSKLGEYDPGRPIRPWLFGFAYRVAADHRRLARHRHEVTGLHAEPFEPGAAADEHIALREDRAIVEAALDAVPLERRAVLVMHDVDDVPVPAIAATLGIPLNTAYSRLRLARADFTDAWKRLMKSRGKP
jgi:RNA polymerase sigma-70 factor (ECF subfamily)